MSRSKCVAPPQAPPPLNDTWQFRDALRLHTFMERASCGSLYGFKQHCSPAPDVRRLGHDNQGQKLEIQSPDPGALYTEPAATLTILRSGSTRAVNSLP